MLDELKMSGRSMTACSPKKSRLKSKIGTVGKLHQLYLGSGDKTTCPDARIVTYDSTVNSSLNWRFP